MSIDSSAQGMRGADQKAIPTRRVSGTDVARAAGVSQRTVSRVVTDDPRVSPDARRRVREAIESLGYRPNSAARSVRLGKTRTIGLLTVGSAAYGPASLTIATERAVSDAGYGFRLVNTVDVDTESVENGLSSLLDQGVDALVVNEPTSTFRSRRHGLAVPVLSLSGAAESGRGRTRGRQRRSGRDLGRGPSLARAWARDGAPHRWPQRVAFVGASPRGLAHGIETRRARHPRCSRGRLVAGIGV